MFRKNKWVILVVLSILYWGTRLINVESDLPKWKTFYYSQVDELFYTIGAFNIISPPDKAYSSVAQKDFLPVSLFEDGITAASLSVFGNNYLGLRFPSMLMGYFILILVFLLFEKRFGNKAALTAAALLFFDVGFLLGNRIAAPTIFRLFGMVAVIYFLQSILNRKLTPTQFFAAGFISCFAFLFFYPTNFFITAATFVFLLLLFIAKRRENTVDYSYLGYYAFACLLCITIFLLISRHIMGDLGRFLNLTGFSGRVAVTGEKTFFDTLKSFASNIKALREASFFVFNPYMLLLAFIAVAYFIVSAFNSYRKKRQITLDQVMAIFLVTFLCQAVFINDYPRKKLLIFFPFVIYSIIYGIDTLQKEYSRNRFIKYAYMTTFPVLALSAFDQFKFVYSNPTYYYKEAMISLKKYDGKIIAGNLSYAFRLYNHYTPLLNYYVYKYNNTGDHQRILKELSADKNFAGSIYYGNEKELNSLQELYFCVGEEILKVNPNLPSLPVYLYVPCNTCVSHRAK